ncbi:MAG: type III pantothenate kinase, partial [Alphaproteobacteria bacterium]|nr:type III pantothenate kinase [Alphaproteobacteria bacterium]
LNTTLRQMGEQLLKCPVAVVGEEVTFATMPIRITRPEDAGVDRLINAKAAYQRNPQAQIIIDFGTATTFDVVAQDGGYEGGAIAPGIGLSFKALHTGTAKLPQIAFDPYRFGIPDPVGKNTADAMKAGIFWGYVGLIKGMTEAIVNSDTDNTLFAHTSPPIVGTGGLADLFAPYITNLETVPDLTIQGLIALWQEYADAASR